MYIEECLDIIKQKFRNSFLNKSYDPNKCCKLHTPIGKTHQQLFTIRVVKIPVETMDLKGRQILKKKKKIVG